MTCIRKGRALAAVVAASSVAAPAALADRAQWRDGFYEGHGEGNVCIAFEVRGSKVEWLRVEGAPECGHRFRCTGRLMRSAPGAAAKALRIKRTGRFRHEVDITRDPPRPGPPPRRVATFITGKLRGARASGTFRTLFEAGGSNRCDSGELHWTARRVASPREDPLEPLVP